MVSPTVGCAGLTCHTPPPCPVARRQDAKTPRTANTRTVTAPRATWRR